MIARLDLVKLRLRQVSVQLVYLLLLRNHHIGNKVHQPEEAVRSPMVVLQIDGSWVNGVVPDHPYHIEGLLDKGLAISERVGFRPEVTLIYLDLVELLLAHYPDERATAIEHLDFAIAEFREIKMQPFLERALRHRGLLHA